MKTTNNTAMNLGKRTYQRPQMEVIMIDTHSVILTVSSSDYDITDGGAGADNEYGD